MDPQEAIAILTKERQEHHSFSTDIIGKAEQLGIEALKRHEARHTTTFAGMMQRLPGETERTEHADHPF